MSVDFYSHGVPCQKSKSGPNIILLHPEFRYRLWRALSDPRLAGSSVYSGARSNEHQAQLRIANGCPDVWTASPSRCRIPTAIPGRSLHNERPAGFRWGNLTFEVPWAIAADIQFVKRPSRVVDPIMQSYGLHRIKSEPWHWQINKTGDLIVIVGEGSRGEAAKEVQTSLNQYLNAGLKVDGHYGTKTGDAVAAFQKARSLPVRRDWTMEERRSLRQIQTQLPAPRLPDPPLIGGKDPDGPERTALRQIRALANKALGAPND